MITIIVPYKNASSWIRRCAESLHQLEGDAEFIFVNDNSTDDSEDVVRAYEFDDRFRFFHNVGTGVGAARNTGLEFAKGDWISFLDADDEYAPGALNAIKASINMLQGAELIQLNHNRVMNTSVAPRMHNPRGKYTLEALPKLWVSSCNKLFKYDLVDHIRFNEDLRHGEDELFVLECLKKTRCIYSSEYVALHYHKDNPNSLSTTTSFDDLLGEQRALLNFLEDNRDDAELCYAVRQRMSELWNNAVYKRTFGG